eukprot:207846_1
MFFVIIGAIIVFTTTICHSQRRGGNRGNDATPTPSSQQHNLLQDAKEKFNNLNHGYYHFQYQKSCFCPICDIQSMNIVVGDNIVSDVKFAEGNDYAETYFCFNDNDQLQNVLNNSQLTILEIFDLIHDSI